MDPAMTAAHARLGDLLRPFLEVRLIFTATTIAVA